MDVLGFQGWVSCGRCLVVGLLLDYRFWPAGSDSLPMLSRSDAARGLYGVVVCSLARPARVGLDTAPRQPEPTHVPIRSDFPIRCWLTLPPASQRRESQAVAK
eukprot:8551528-Pyramimonas_sp.AAC.1